LFVVCLVAAVPFAWGEDGIGDLNGKASASLEGVKIDVLKVGVTLCHIPPDNPANAQTIVVREAAVAAHLAHGDYLGECAQACAGVPSAVPKTGQTACWDAGGAPIACAGTGQDGEYQLGASASPRFTDNADGTVTDNLTGLIWLQNANCIGRQTWTDALTASNALASGACGLTDGSVVGTWRLPNVKELQSLLDFSQTNPALPPLPPGYPFSGVQSFLYWSSTTYASGPLYAWVVYLDNGDVYSDDKRNDYFVWPVRGGQ
jgi:hypothetical protein